LLEELKRRVQRDWQAYRFDPIVVEAAARLGFDGLDVVGFRSRHLDSWRKVVAVADDGAIQGLLERRIEKDLSISWVRTLPLSAREFLERVPRWTPAELGALMLALRSTGLAKATVAELLAAALGTASAKSQPPAE
jgi:hypothetical protein